MNTVCCRALRLVSICTAPSLLLARVRVRGRVRGRGRGGVRGRVRVRLARPPPS